MLGYALSAQKIDLGVKIYGCRVTFNDASNPIQQ